MNNITADIISLHYNSIMPKKRVEQPLLELNDIVNNIFEGDCLQIMKKNQ